MAKQRNPSGNSNKNATNKVSNFGLEPDEDDEQLDKVVVDEDPDEDYDADNYEDDYEADEKTETANSG